MEFERRILKVAFKPRSVPISVFNRFYHPFFHMNKKFNLNKDLKVGK